MASRLRPALLGAILAAGIVPATAAPTDGAAKRPPRIVIPERVVDLGILVRGTVHNARFAIRNDGEQTLRIREARPGCKCTVTEFDELIPAGKTGYVNATIDSHSLWGRVSRFVTIYSNDPTLPRTRLQIDAVVVGSVELLPTARLQLTNRKRELSRALLLVRQDRTESGTLALTGLAASEPWLAVQATQLTEKRPAGDGLPVGRPGDWVIEARLAGQPPPGRTEGELVFKTGLEREPTVRVPVGVQFQPAVELSRESIELYGSSPDMLLVGLRDGLDPGQLTVRAEPDALEATLEPSGDRHFKLHLSWNGAPGAGAVTLSIAGESYRVPVAKR